MLLELLINNICTVLGKCAKIDFPSQSECNVGATKTVLTVFSWKYRDLARTNDTLESVHFLW